MKSTFIIAVNNIVKRNQIVYLIIFILALFIIGGCDDSHNKKNQSTPNSVSDSKGSKDTTSDSLTVHSNVVQQNNIQPYKGVDSLLQLVLKNHSNAQLLKLDRICKKSDGDLSEYFNEVSINLFTNDLSGFTEYLVNNPNSCLKKELIEGIGLNLSVYEKSERLSRLSQERDSIIVKGHKEGLSDKKILLIIDIFKNVNLNVLD